MINEHYYRLGAEPSAIRQLFAYGMQRKREIGADKVFDFSIGNPSVPTPTEVVDAARDLLSGPAAREHGYTPASGDPTVCKKLAEDYRRRFGIDATPAHFYLTCGAAAALSISLAALTNPGDEVIVLTPYFPEYRVWIEAVGAVCVEVPADAARGFRPDIAALRAAISPKTAALIINSPNNPTGVIYPEDDVRALGELLRECEEAFNRPLFLISDEPYREITYGAPVAVVPAFYDNTVVCYSYSKCFSLPGERIGYIYVNDRMAASLAARVIPAIAGAGRALGFVSAPALWQRSVAASLTAPVDIESYRVNREALCGILRTIGYEFVEPQGAFYLWMKALEPDAQAFCERAKNYELLLVASDSFGVPGWVRVSYCVPHETIVHAYNAFLALKESYSS